MAEQMIQHKEGEKVATQAIPTGYKQTEVGVIPKDWEVMLVGDSFTVCNNLRLPISSKVRDGMSGSYPYYGPTKIQGYINEYRVEGEFALIGEDGDHFLKFDSVNQTQLVSGKFNVNNHVHLIKGNVGSAKWFYWFFRNRDISIYLTRQGAGRFKLNKASLERIQCAIPPTEEQLAIATVLSDSDALIVSLGQLIAKKQAIKTAAMQQLLTGRTRLPQFALRPDGTPKGYKTSELGQIPEDWDATTLGDISEVCMCKRIFSSQTVEVGEIPFYKIGTFGGEPDAYISVSLYKKFRDKYSFPEKGDILISAAGTLGKTVIYDGCSAYFQDSNIVWLKIDKSKICNEYLYHAYKLIRWASPEGSTISRLYNGIIRATMIVIPTLLEQTTIATILSDMDSELTALEQKLAKARDVKQGMMQQLLTGRIRLPVEQVE
ncbi:restriction endonuclease subunit S [Aeromonas sp. 600479]|uniref:restriction endonuclease subunit S n=1 Tax=Aeromonas sp. 600479 TaxID=2712028 RepID=UPI003B9F80D5